MLASFLSPFVFALLFVVLPLRAARAQSTRKSIAMCSIALLLVASLGMVLSVVPNSFGKARLPAVFPRSESLANAGANMPCATVNCSFRSQNCFMQAALNKPSSGKLNSSLDATAGFGVTFTVMECNDASVFSSHISDSLDARFDNGLSTSVDKAVSQSGGGLFSKIDQIGIFATHAIGAVKCVGIGRTIKKPLIGLAYATTLGQPTSLAIVPASADRVHSASKSACNLLKVEDPHVPRLLDRPTVPCASADKGSGGLRRSDLCTAKSGIPAPASATTAAAPADFSLDAPDGGPAGVQTPAGTNSDCSMSEPPANVTTLAWLMVMLLPPWLYRKIRRKESAGPTLPCALIVTRVRGSRRWLSLLSLVLCAQYAAADDGVSLLGSASAIAGRRLQTTTTVSTIADLRAAVDDSSIGTILVAAGTYTFSNAHTSASCGDSAYNALCITRAVRIEAVGQVVLKAHADGGSTNRRVIRLEVPAGGKAELVGLHMSNGKAVGGEQPAEMRGAIQLTESL